MGQFLDEKEEKKIADTIAQIEKTTIGEIRVAVVLNSKEFGGENPVYAHALHVFHENGLQNTKAKTGVLIMISMEERRLEILGDTGINKKIEQTTWDSMAENLAQQVRDNQICEGICDLVIKIGGILAEHFPSEVGDTNELSNTVIEE